MDGKQDGGEITGREWFFLLFNKKITKFDKKIKILTQISSKMWKINKFVQKLTKQILSNIIAILRVFFRYIGRGEYLISGYFKF